MFAAHSTQDQLDSHTHTMNTERHWLQTLPQSPSRSDRAVCSHESSATHDEPRTSSSPSSSEADDRDSGGAATSTPVAERPRTAPAPPKVDRLPPWRVILHNDDVNDIGFVVETIIELLRVNPRQALTCTLTAHRKGLAQLTTTHREKAELLRDQFRSRSLMVTIEPEA